MRLSLSLCFFFIVYARAYAGFKDNFPNADNVRDPCGNGVDELWGDAGAIGHNSRTGGGPRNVFGIAYDQTIRNGGKTWADLCRLDSDGDGRTNGEELQDPSCLWKKGNPNPGNPSLVTHPGYVDEKIVVGGKVRTSKPSHCLANRPSPVAAESCITKKNYKNDPNIKSLRMTLEKVALSSEETIYMCQAFEMPTDQEYEIVAFRHITDTPDELHHIIAYSCDQEYEYKEMGEHPTKFATPTSCFMDSACNTITMVWGFGQSDTCMEEGTAWAFPTMVPKVSGKRTYMIELHFNNPMKKSGIVSTSSLEIFYRPKTKGIQELATVLAGVQTFAIPPGKPNYSIEEDSSIPCQKQAFGEDKKYFFSTLLLHMHTTGVGGSVQIIRDGKVRLTLFEGKVDYEKPLIKALNSVEFNPTKDVIRTKCVMDTRTRDTYTFQGKGTRDEMCYAIFTVYPTPPWGKYIFMAADDVGRCEEEKWKPLPGFNQPFNHKIMRTCNWEFFRQFMDYKEEKTMNMTIFEEIKESCLPADGVKSYGKLTACPTKCGVALYKWNMFYNTCMRSSIFPRALKGLATSDELWTIQYVASICTPDTLFRHDSIPMSVLSTNARNCLPKQENNWYHTGYTDICSIGSEAQSTSGSFGSQTLSSFAILTIVLLAN